MAALAVGVIGPSILVEHQVLILAVGIAVGLPHGAVDHLVPFWTGWVRPRPRTLMLILAGYLLVAAVTWVGLRAAGAVVLPLLLLLSVLHFGAGDLMAERGSRSGAAKLSSGEFVVSMVARGGVVLAGPLMFWPAVTSRVLASISPEFGVPPTWMGRAVAAAVGLCVLVSAVCSLRRHDHRSAAEVVLLAALFIVVPPLAAFGIYFGLWHGLRHSLRLISADPKNAADLSGGRLWRPIGRFLGSAALPTVVAAGSAAALILIAHQHSLLAAELFSVLFALTVPHLVIVALLDLKRPPDHDRPRRLSTITRRPQCLARSATVGALSQQPHHSPPFPQSGQEQ